ncbi:MAG: monovalent cation/H(+) antiporter subunit G [Deltaproteobacteria bacterium]|nr:monovalent cation/H(+) antiporter subunit G [Deltaproteobacteria bacterium]
MVIALIVIVCVVAGLVFFAGGTLGLLRFPDFYSRLHPAGKLDTMGALLVILGLAIHQLFPVTLGSALTGLKLILIVVFVFLASPTATHAIVDAGFRAGLEPWKKGDPWR